MIMVVLGSDNVSSEVRFVRTPETVQLTLFNTICHNTNRKKISYNWLT